MTRNYSITGHMVVKNEDRWVWFSIMSVINYLDKLIIFDTGSIDKTVSIIESIMKIEKYKKKIIFERIDGVSVDNFYQVRQKQIDMTDTDYFMIIDGDEIWWEESLKELDTLLHNDSPDLVATKFINCCNDVYHYRFDERETYCINNIVGSITIRVYSMKIPGISCGGKYGVEGFIDGNKISVQDGNYLTSVMTKKYLHTSLLNRSSSQYGDYSIKYRRSKLRYLPDAKFPKNFKFPEVFYMEYPRLIKSPFEKDFNIIRIFYQFIRRIKIALVKRTH